eukprot:EG_transcript_1651
MSHSITQPRPNLISGFGPQRATSAILQPPAQPAKVKRPSHAASPKKKKPEPEPAEVVAPAVARPSTTAAEVDRAVLERVNVRMNEYIAEKFPDVPLLPSTDVNISSMVRLAKQLWVAAEWEVSPDPFGEPVELDILGFCLNEDGVAPKHQDMVYWGNPASSTSALTYQSGGIGDDRLTFKVEFYAAKVARCQEVAFFAHVRDAHRRRQSLANVRGLRLRLYHKYNDRYRVLARLELGPPFRPDATAVEVLRLRCQADGWHAVHVGRQFDATRHATPPPRRCCGCGARRTAGTPSTSGGKSTPRATPSSTRAGAGPSGPRCRPPRPPPRTCGWTPPSRCAGACGGCRTSCRKAAPCSWTSSSPSSTSSARRPTSGWSRATRSAPARSTAAWRGGRRWRRRTGTARWWTSPSPCCPPPCGRSSSSGSSAASTSCKGSASPTSVTCPCGCFPRTRMTRRSTSCFGQTAAPAPS